MGIDGTTYAALQSESAAEVLRPLCVDLDGTLVKSDTLVDSLLILARSHPSQVVKVPIWILRGRAVLKARVASLVSLDPAHLPYNHKLLSFLQQQHGEGRTIYLATGADSRTANRIAEHLAIFSGVLASDGLTNLTGKDKLHRLRTALDSQEFDYVGNARPDWPLLLEATQAMVANPTYSLRKLLRSRKLVVHRTFQDRSFALPAFFQAIRVHQWAKNALVFLPMLLAHAFNRPTFLKTLLAFLCFSLCASATYVVNDLLDIETDRRHAKKRHRVFASGNLAASTGMGIVILFWALASIGLRWLPGACVGWCLAYIACTMAYSMWLKQIVLVDVIVLSGLYTLRMLAGAAAGGIVISPWLAALSIFLFLSLAMVKRYSELQNLRASGLTPRNGRGYLLVDIDQLRSFGTSSAYAAVVVFALYINGREVTSVYAHPQRLWLATPLLILWVSRIWLLASRGLLDEDPVVFALTDRMSLLIGAAISLIAFVAI